jgi:hypothetical protein
MSIDIFILGGIGMKKGISLILVISLLVAMTSFFVSAYPATALSTSGSSYISLDLNKNTAKVGDIIKAVVKINDIGNFAGYQVNIKYDPTVLQAVHPETLVPFSSNTMPKDGNLLVNSGYGPVSGVLNNTAEGILNFGKAYTYINDYKAAYPEKSGVLAEIGFKVIKEQGNTTIKFANCDSMPGSLTGTMLFDYDGKVISNYTVIQPQTIIISDSGHTAPPSSIGKISVEWSKDTVAVGDKVTASIKADDFDNLAGYQFNIKYDPTLLEPIVSKTEASYSNNTMPEDGTILVNPEFGVVAAVSNNIQNGILNFGKSYTYLKDYKDSGVPEKSGIIAQITFKVLKPIYSTGLSFEDSLTMPEGTNGTLVYNWNGDRIQGYSVISSNSIKISNGGTIAPTVAPTITPTAKPTVTPTAKPTVTPTKNPTPTPTNTPASDGSIEIELDKNSAKVGDTIKAVVKVNNINCISGYQVNIKYDPDLLQPINPDTGKAFSADTMPGKGTVIANEDFGLVSVAVNDLSKGIINFSKSYTYIDDYRKSGVSEKTGTLGVINFKVLKAGKTSVNFEDSITMPTSILGTMIFDWNTKRIDGYKVIQPEIIELSGSAVPTPIPTPVVTVKPTDGSSDNSFIEIKLDKNQAKVGDIIKASVNIKNIDNFAGYQVNVKYDPQVLQPVDLTTGRPLSESQMPNDGTILVNTEFGVVSAVLNNLQEGVLNFGKTYSYLSDYRLSNKPEESGTIAQIGFKALKEKDTYIGFEKTITMPESISGASLYDWNGILASGYTVINPDIIKISGTTPTSDGYISIELDKNNAAVGEIINATLKVNNIKNFSGYQVNIKYDPEVLKPINPITGDKFTARTELKNSTILLDQDYLTTEIALHDLAKGVLNFSKSYIFLDDYKMSAKPEESGVLGIIGFEVLKETSTKIYFEDTAKMPGSITGTILFDWNGAQVSGYEVIQPGTINGGGSGGGSYIALELDKNTADVGDIIKATVKVNNIDNLAGYQVNIKYDSNVLQPINLENGSSSFTKRTNFASKGLLTNSSYGPTDISLHDLTAGALNFSSAYTFMSDYKSDGVAEESGVIGVIGFKVLKKESTSISFENNASMPGCIKGTILFDWNGDQVSGYEVIQSGTINGGGSGGGSYIALELDKNTANVGDIIKATVKVNNIDNLAGYQVNIKYDPNVLQPINLENGSSSFGKRTNFAFKEMLTNSSYGPTDISLHDLTAGVLNFSSAYTFMSDYKSDGVSEESGVIGVIGFKVLKKESTSISFENNASMPGCIEGTILFDWNGQTVTGYSVVQSDKIN